MNEHLETIREALRRERLHIEMSDLDKGHEAREFARIDAALVWLEQAETWQATSNNTPHQEENTMSSKNDRTYYITAEMLGDQADETDARRMVEILSARGYDVQLGHPRSYQSDDDIATKDWQEGLDIISKEKHS